MDQPAASKSGPLVPLSTNPEVNRYLTKGNEKFEQLKADGLTRGDRETLKKRLGYVWAESDEKPIDQGNSLKIWRYNRARLVYMEIQDINDHIFLAFILTISPTECVGTNFKDVLHYIADLEDYSPPQLNLGPKAKGFFESTSAEQGFTGSRHYVRFMESIFPQQKDLRQIRFAYSLIGQDEIALFLETILEGIFTSQLQKRETEQGMKTSESITVFVPTGEEDGSCNIVVDRKVVMKAIRKFELSALKLE